MYGINYHIFIRIEARSPKSEVASVSRLRTPNFLLKFILCCFFISLRLSSFSQQNKIDSLLTLLKNDKEDTCKITHLNDLAGKLANSNYDTAMVLATQALILSENIIKNSNEGSDLWVAGELGTVHSYITLSMAYGLKGDFAFSLEKCKNGLHILEELETKNHGNKTRNIKELKSNIIGNIGIIYCYNGKYPESLDCFFKTLKIAEELGNKNSVQTVLGNIGLLYQALNNSNKALDYYFKALKIAEDLGDKESISRHSINIGSIYQIQKEYSKALNYYSIALKVAEEQKSKRNILFSIRNIGTVYSDKGDYFNALDYLFKALRTSEDLGDKSQIAAITSLIGSVYISLFQYKEAENYLIKGSAIFDSIGDLDGKCQSQRAISMLYEITGKYKLAYQHYKIYSQLKESLFAIEKDKDITRKEMNYEFEKKEAATKAEIDKQMALEEIDKKRRALATGSFAGGALLVLIIIVVVIRSLQLTHRRKLIIEKQKEIVEEKQKEMLDSIHYAKHIQKAVLKGEEYIKTHLANDHFILFKPKDIVSGDFYWFSKQKDKIIIAVADCTGHGVPGGFMTMLGTSFLNEIVEKKGILKPAEILTEMHKSVLNSLNQTAEEADAQDGMEMALCCIDTKNKTLEFSGAMSSIYLMQNNMLKKIEEDYYSVGGTSLLGTDNKTNFTNKIVALEKNTLLYLFTDGYMDQFGGVKKEKFNISRFETLLTSISSESTDVQKQKIKEAMEQWMKPGYAQVDDMLVMGIKI